MGERLIIKRLAEPGHHRFEQIRCPLVSPLRWYPSTGKDDATAPTVLNGNYRGLKRMFHCRKHLVYGHRSGLFLRRHQTAELAGPARVGSKTAPWNADVALHLTGADKGTIDGCAIAQQRIAPRRSLL